MRSTRIDSTLRAIALGISLTLATPALAADEHNAGPGLTAAGAPLGLHGFDPVAYFTESAAKPGAAEHAASHDGITYYFASDANRKTFEADPARYAPAFGGFCAYGVSVGKKFDGDPRFWTVSGGRLFLNLNREIAAKFAEDVAGSVAKADGQWRKIEHRGASEL